MPTTAAKIAALGVALASVGLLGVVNARGLETIDEVRILDCPESGAVVAARTDADGTIHLLYQSAGGPQYVKSVDHGKMFTVPMPVVADKPQVEGLEFSGWDLAVGRGGSVHVALGSNAWKLKLPEEQWGCYYARLDSGATRFASLRNVNRKPSEGFSLAADAKGNLTLCWLSERLYANVSHDDGLTFGPILEINSSYDPCNCCTTSAAYGSNGRLAILYREETADQRDMHVVLWNQAAGDVKRTRISDTPWKINACPMTYFSIAHTSSGFIAAWPTKGEIYFARLDADGKPQPPGETKTPGASGMRTGILALSSSDGKTLIAWKKDGRLNWQLYSAGGRPIGDIGSVTSRGDGVAGIVDGPSRFILLR